MEMKTYYLYPGDIFAHKEPHRVTTILGSCVSVCLFDPFLSIGAINHFMLPVWDGKGLAMPKYGNIAIMKVIEKMELLGSKRQSMVAKLFGGASLSYGSGPGSVGSKNIILAKDMLSDEGVRVVASDLGGSRGRRLLYYTSTGRVRVRHIKETMPLKAV